MVHVDKLKAFQGLVTPTFETDGNSESDVQLDDDDSDIRYELNVEPEATDEQPTTRSKRKIHQPLRFAEYVM